MPLKGVLLDIDGTLVLSNDAHARAWMDAFAEHGITIRFEDVRPLIGMGADKIVPALSPRLHSTEGVGRDIDETRKRIFLSKYAPDVQPAPGSRALLERMRADGLKLSIASSAHKQELNALLKTAAVDDILEIPESRSEGKDSKPSADTVTIALQRAHLKPRQAIMLGDTPFDILAAAKCDVRTIAVRCGGWDDARLRDAIAIYDHPADLLAHYEQSPLRAAVNAGSQHGHR